MTLQPAKQALCQAAYKEHGAHAALYGIPKAGEPGDEQQHGQHHYHYIGPGAWRHIEAEGYLQHQRKYMYEQRLPKVEACVFGSALGVEECIGEQPSYKSDVRYQRRRFRVIGRAAVSRL